MARNRRAARVTLNHVAHAAGVSVSTVSLVLSRRKKYVDQFNPRTVQRVLETAESLGYHRNLFAKSIQDGDQPFFGLVLPQPDEDGGVSGAACAAIMQGIMEAAWQRGLYVVSVTLPCEARRADICRVTDLIDGGMDGCIACSPPPALEPMLKKRMESEYPVVVVAPREPADWSRNVVDLDHAAAGQLAAKAMAELERHSALLVTSRQSGAAGGIRATSFIQAARVHGLKVETIDLATGLSREQAVDLVARHIHGSDTDAAFAVDRRLTWTTVLANWQFGLASSRCKIIGSNLGNGPETADLLSIDGRWSDLGRQAVERLTRLRGTTGGSGKCAFKPVRVSPSIVYGGEPTLRVVDIGEEGTATVDAMARRGSRRRPVAVHLCAAAS